MTHPEPRGVKCLQTGGTGETTRASLKKKLWHLNIASVRTDMLDDMLAYVDRSA